MPKKKSSKSRKQKSPDPQELVVLLYREYASHIGENLWPWETARWHELVFCILTTIGEPQVLAGTLRDLTNILSKSGLLEIGSLAKIDPSRDNNDPLLVTIETLLKKTGLTSKEARTAVTAICEAALIIQKKYDGKIQNCLRKYGTYMLDQMSKDFGFSQFDDASKALSIWLQNTLNMPVPASNPLADKACEYLGVSYNVLVEAANQQDINIALLDDALRAHWVEMSPGGESKNIKNQSSERT